MLYSIRPLNKQKGEFQQAESLSRLVWGPASTDLAHIMIGAVEAGGLVLGAFVPGGELVGFCLAFPAFREGRVWLHSHSMAVHPDHRGQGLARSLKLRQRVEALDLGLDLITWTYDPLRSVNAYVNLHRLGATVGTYSENYYGPMQDKLNADLPSDRVLCRWKLMLPSVLQRLDGTYRSPTIPGDAVAFDRSGTLRRGRIFTAGRYAFMPIPGDIDKLLGDDLRLALEWRLLVRKQMQELLGEGYTGVDFCTVRDGNRRAGVYVFEGDGSL